MASTYTGFTIANLIDFNEVETTDVIHGVTQIPYYKPLAYVPGVTYSNGWEEYTPGRNGRGSQVIIRELGKGSATVVSANTANAFKYSHAETADTITTIPINTVIKQSEEVYEAVEVARQSADGARKAQIVMNNIIAEFQKLISGALESGAHYSGYNTDFATTAPLTKTTIKDVVANIIGAKLDIVPDTMAVTKKIYALLLQLTTDGSFTHYHGFDTVRTGIVGQFMGLNVVVDEDLTTAHAEVNTDFIIYNHNYLYAFTLLHNLSVKEANAFDGSYVRGLMLAGTHAPIKTLGNGAWAYRQVTGTGSPS